MPKVSVIIPVYNSEKYLRKCLDSVISQSLVEIEIICVDDCSADSSKKVLDDYAKNDARIKVLQNEKNMGLSSTRNNALKTAVGEYVQFLDSDDYLHGNDTLETLYTIANAHKLDLLKSQIILQENEVLQSYFQYPACIVDNVYSGRELLCQLEQFDVCARVAISNFVRLNFLREHEIFFYQGILHEDILFSFELYESVERAMCVRKDTYVYVKHENTITTRLKSAAHLRGHLVTMREILKRDFTVFSVEFRYAAIKYLIRIYREIISVRNQLDYIALSEILSDDEMCQLYHEIFRVEKWKHINMETMRQNIKKIEQSRKLYLYGAGNAARELAAMLIERDIAIDGVFVTDTKNSAQTLCGHRVQCIDDCDNRDKEALFLVAITRKYLTNALDTLHARGYDNVIYVC